MGPGRLPIPSSTSQTQGGSDGGMGRQCSNGKGGKLRLSRLLFRKKPYDRPPDADALQRRLPSGRQASSLPARLVDSASNLLTSSASYLFESFFKRRQVRWIGDGSQSAAKRGSTDAVQADELQPPSEHDRQPIDVSPQDPSRRKAADEDAEFLEVEEFLKRQSLSRDDVKRLTKVLQTRVHGGGLIAPNSEGDVQCNAIIQASKESSPAQLAKSYMDRRTPPQWQSTPSRLHGGIGPFSRAILDYGAKESSLEAPRRKVAPGTSRFLKRRYIADEDDIVLTVPARRVRQRLSVTANSSPYIRQITAAAGRPQTPSLEPKKPTDKAEKSEEHLEGFLLTSKGKSMEDPCSVLSPNGDVDVPESSKARDRAPSAEKDPYPLQTSSEVAEPSFADPVPALIAASSPPEMAEPSSEVPTSTVKGFHINAFFEDSSSDEEPVLPKKPSLLSEVQAPNLMVPNEELLHPTTASKVERDDTVKGPCAVALDKSPHVSEVTFAKVPVSVAQQLNGSTGPSHTKQDSPPVTFVAAQEPFNPAPIGSTTGTPAFSLPSLKPPSQDSHLPLWAEKKMDSEGRNSSRLPPSTFSTFKSPSKATLSVSQAEAGTASVSSSPLETTIGNDSANKEGAKVKTEAIQSPDKPALKAENAAANIVIPAVVPNISTAAESSAGFVSPSPLFGVAPGSTLLTPASMPLTPASMPPTPALPAVPQGSMIETQPTNTNATHSPSENGGIRHSPMFESPSAENRQSDMDNMATDPMTEELDGSVGVPAASGSLFGSISNTASTSAGENVSFGSHTSLSPFSFPMQSSTTSGVSQSPFSNHTIGSGQPFSYGMSAPSTVANPFSGATQSTFLFGSSAAPSTASIFPATSSAPLTFPAISPAPSPFLFGAQASTLSSNNSSSIFGQPTQSASGFTAGTAQNNTSTFSFQAPPPTSSPSPIQFGVANAGTSSSSSAPLFGGQNFGFGVQPPGNTPANPFALSGGSSTSPFQFGAASVTVGQPTNFAFGAQPAASPSPFTFGAQTAPPPTEQPFAFGSQPAAPAPTPFNLPGSTGQGPPGGASGMEFAGGFSLGAAGGEKAGRKIFKAKRIGGAKRGK